MVQEEVKKSKKNKKAGASKLQTIDVNKDMKQCISDLHRGEVCSASSLAVHCLYLYLYFMHSTI